MVRARVSLSGARATMLGTLYARALDAAAAEPILGDELARQVVERLDYDFSLQGVTPAVVASVVVRARFFDGWAREFLAAHERATVVHLGAGLDTRLWRLDPGPAVTWYDVDYPDVVDLRRAALPGRANAHSIGASVTEPGWEREIPADDPVLIMAEGLTMYLPRVEGHALFRRLTAHFGSGVLAVDTQNSVALRMQSLNPVVRRTGSTLLWPVDDPGELERAVRRLHLLDAVDALYAPGAEELPRATRVTAALLRPIRPLRTLSMYLRYGF